MSRFFVFVVAGALAAVSLGLVIEGQSQTQFAISAHASPGLDSNADIYAPGRVEGAARETEIRPQAAGRVVEVLVVEGEWVEAGDVLLRLDDLQHRQEVSIAQAELAYAEGQLRRVENGARSWEREEAEALHQAKSAELEQAQLALGRVENLRQSAVAQQELDDQRTRVLALTAETTAARARAELLAAPAREDELEIARANVAAAGAKLGLAQVQLERMQIRAAAAGQILAVEARLGEHLDPLMSQAPLVMADTRRLRVRAFVEEFDAPRVAPGMMARVTADGVTEELSGRVGQVSPRMGAKEIWSDRPSERHDTKTREVWIDLDGSANLVIGLRVDVMIHPDPSDQAPAKRFDYEPQRTVAPELSLLQH
jgi:multidrug resistance efflux pump